MLKAEQMRALPQFFADIPDPRRAQGRRHPLSTVLAIAAGAVLCGMRGYKAISDWAKSLEQKARERFGCRYRNGRYIVPSEYVIRNVLIRVDPVHLDRALQCWNQLYAQEDETLAIDGKTMCNAIDNNGHKIHIMSVVGHKKKICYTHEITTAVPLIESIDIKDKGGCQILFDMIETNTLKAYQKAGTGNWMDKKAIKIANLTEEQIAQIKEVEEKLENVCLVAVEKQDAIFVLEAKLAPNQWEPISNVYPEIDGMSSYFSTRDDALLAKSSLKNLLKALKAKGVVKRPIRIRKLS